MTVKVKVQIGVRVMGLWVVRVVRMTVRVKVSVSVRVIRVVRIKVTLCKTRL